MQRIHPMAFGRREMRGPVAATGRAPSTLDDIRSFGLTFAAGFVFFSLFFA